VATLNELIEQTVQGLGYEVVDVERAPNGLLRIFIDHAWQPSSTSEDTEAQAPSIKIEDCEVVSRQLSRVFEVEGVNYERLEISSPGMDRPLKKLQDFQRFAGCEVNVKLRLPFNGRKQYTGVLQYSPESGPALQWVADSGEQLELRFTPEEVDKAKLVPKYKF
jgi:ribosome maturation factor RimP